jgi:hypothetical protein
MLHQLVSYETLLCIERSQWCCVYVVYEHEDRQNNRPLVINLLIQLLVILSGYIHVTIVKHLPSLQLQAFIMSMFTSWITLLSVSSLYIRAYACHACNRHPILVCWPVIKLAHHKTRVRSIFHIVIYMWVCVCVYVCADRMFPTKKQVLYKQQWILYTKIQKACTMRISWG